MLYAQVRKEFERSVIGELNRPRAANHDSCCGPASDEWPPVHDRLHNALDGANGQDPLAGAANINNLGLNLNAVTSTDTGSDFDITVNIFGAFFRSVVGVGYGKDYAKQIQGLVGGTPQAQYFILLHELAHFFKASGFVQNDGNNIPAQQFNNDLIWKDCSKTIQGAGAAGIA